MKKVFLIFFVTMVVLAGCTNEQGMPEQEIVEQDTTITVGTEDREIIERAESISDLIVDLYGIDDATTVILNDTAIIGIKIAYDQKITDEIKNLIVEKVKEKDPLITNIKITDKKNLFSQIDNIITKLLQGTSYDSLVDDINKIENKIRWL